MNNNPLSLTLGNGSGNLIRRIKKTNRIVSGFSSDQPIRIKELIEQTSSNSKSLSVYRDSQSRKGIVFSPKYGYLELTLPRFCYFLKTKQ